ncbi:N-formylglutamate deformylase [Azohydromonas australica]|uniref:N-formylglutamate deformylase n=1 Tax=Azohydromonas australica TaxID=364039 RepID=UPI000423671B|nr:N-formylglutamate deformylase [Azohydromonas australica]
MTQESPVYALTRGTQPLLLSIPHLGTELPADIAAQMNDVASVLRDTDWHLDRLYEFAASMGASVLQAKLSRYVIDLNRPPNGESLYPGKTTTGLCPTETFPGESLYAPGQEPDAAEQARRLEGYWRPYHDALTSELARIRAEHGCALLWDAHSIASVLPRLFEGKLPDLNFGTADGKSCDGDLLKQVITVAGKSPFTIVVNGRFKGGYITRHYGRPEDAIHAIQLEMCQSLYMNEAPPFEFEPDKAAAVQPVLRGMLESALAHVRKLNAR